MPDEAAPTQQGVPDLSWETVGPEFQKNFPGLDPEAMRKDWEHRVKLTRARWSAEASAPEDTGSFMRREMTPFLSTGIGLTDAVGYGRALKRMKAGTHTDEDYNTIANYEEQQKRDQEATSTLGGAVARGAAKLPAMVGEFAAGGAALKGIAGLAPKAVLPYLSAQAAEGAGVAIPKLTTLAGVGAGTTRVAATTATVPAMYAEQWAAGNIKAGRDPLDPRGLPAAFGMGMIQTAILGSVGKQAAAAIPSKGLAGGVLKAGAAGIAGVGETQAADIVTSTLAHVLPYAEAADTGFGTIGQLAEGKRGEAGRHVAVQALTFAAFSAMHGHDPKPILENTAEQLQQAVKGGLSSDGAAKKVAVGLDKAMEGVEVQPTPGRPWETRIEGNVNHKSQAERDKFLAEHPGWEATPGSDTASRWKPLKQEPPQTPPVTPEAAKPPGGQPPTPPPPMPPQGQPETPKLPLEDLVGIARGLGLKATGSRDVLEKRIRDANGGDFIDAALQPKGPQVIKPEPRPPDQSGPGELKSDLDETTKALGLGPALREVPVEPAKPTEGLEPRTEPSGKPPLSPEEAATLKALTHSKKFPDLGNKAAFDSEEPATAVALTDVDKLGSMPKERGDEVLRGKIEALRAAGLEPYHLGQDEFAVRGNSPTELEAKLEDARKRLQASHGADFSYGIGRDMKSVDQPLREMKEAKKNPPPALAPEPPAKPLTGVERMRQRQGQTAPAARPQASRGMRQPEVKTKPQTANEFEAHGLTPIESLVYSSWRANGGDYREIAKDPELAKLYGREPSHQSVVNWANKAHEKMGGVGSLAKSAGGEGRARMIEDGVLTNDADFHADPETHRAVGKRADELNTIDSKLTQLVDRYENGKINEEDFASEYGRLSQQVEGGASGKARPPGAVPGQGKGSPSKRPGGTGELPAEPPVPAAAEQGPQGTAPQDAAPGPTPGAGDKAAGNKLGEHWTPTGQGGTGTPGAASPGQAPPPPTHNANLISAPQGPPQPPAEPQPATSWFQKAKDFIKSFAGQQFPATTRLARDAGEDLAEAANSKTAARASMDYFNRILKGPDGTPLGNMTPDQKRWVGAVWIETRLRHERERLIVEQKPSGHIGTLVGGNGSPLASEADYQEGHRALWSWFEAVRQHWAPEVDANYQNIQGLDPHDMPNTPSQIPGLPLNLIALDAPESAQGVAGVAGTKGMAGLKIKKPGMTKQAGLDAPAYDLDVGHMMERTLNLGVPAGTRAKFVRTAIENGVIQKVMPGETPEPGFKHLGLDPAAGLHGLEKNANYYVHPDAYREVVQGLGIGERPGALVSGIKAVTDRMYNFALAAPVDVITHVVNNLTAQFRSGMGIPGLNVLTDTIPNMFKVVQRNPEMMKRIADLAQIGASFEHEAKPGILGERLKQYDPTYYLNKWTSGFIDTLQKAVRVQLDDAFTKVVKVGDFPDTPTNRRNFINQAVGNYSSQASNQVGQFLKDTGLQGFFTATSTFTTQGIKAGLGDAINAPTTSTASAIKLRAQALAKMLPLLALGPVINSLRWGQAFPEGVPSFAIKTREDEDGKAKYYDQLSLAGIRRGWRAIGVNGLIEGNREGQTTGQIMDRVKRDTGMSLEHLFAGPPAQFLHTAATGENALGRKVAETPEPGGSKGLQNLKAALKGVNPVIATLSQSDRPKSPRTALENLMQSIGPLGEKTAGEHPAVRNFYDRLRGLEDHRRESPERKRGLAYPHEAEYQKLHAFLPALTKMSKAISNEKVPAERKAAIRQQQVLVAKRALGQ